MRSVSWVFTALMKRARDSERTLARRLNEACARGHEKYRELPHDRDREQERRLLGSQGTASAMTTAGNRAREHRAEIILTQDKHSPSLYKPATGCCETCGSERRRYFISSYRRSREES
jgi:hypothetical protein